MTERQIFDDWPDRYDRWFETPLGKAVLATERELVLDMLRPQQGELILDAGSGTGIFTGAFIARGSDLVGLDISFAMLRRAAEKKPALAGREVAADMKHLPFADEVFDRSVSVTALEFIADAKRAVAELLRVTKRGGIVVVATLNSLSPWAERRLADARRDSESVFNRVFFRAPAELLALAPVAGVTRTAVHFDKDDPPADWARIEREGRGSDRGAFLAALWEKPSDFANTASEDERQMTEGVICRPTSTMSPSS
jgi:ubiquinone/menaquinone biosynthesis C-methylase UbiE